jgi:hypothetical protein
MTAAFLFWLAAHWKELPSIFPPDAGPIWHQGQFQSVKRSLIGFTVLGLWIVAQGVAMWYGSARTTAHRAFFNLAIASQWAHTLMLSAVTIFGSLHLDWFGTTLCGMATGLSLVIVFAHRLKNASSGVQLGYGCYFDFDDPTIFGPRGMNMGHPWQWALCAGALIPSLLIFFLP